LPFGEPSSHISIKTIIYDMELRNYKFRLYPSRKQINRLSGQFEICRRAYNELLEISIGTYENTGKGLSKFDLDKCIKYLDTNTDIVFSQVLQNINDRIGKAFKNFFRRAKKKKSGKHIKVGYPRFKKHFKSITYPQMGFRFKSGRRLCVSKIGSMPIVLHRAPKGKIKTMTIKRNNANQWFAVFGCEVDIKPKKHISVKSKVGIDVGLENFATLSDGITIQNPRFLVKSEKRLARYQRRLSRKSKGSNNRRKAILKTARVHNKIANQRTDFMHKQSRAIADKYGFIAVEKLSINGMVHNHHLAKHINDASWGNFIKMLGYKAWNAGGRVVEVNPRGTSQTCSNCGKAVPKSLSVRTHKCPFCGLRVHRDLNSSIEILNRATVGRTGSHACGDGASALSKKDKASPVVEAGTICGSSQFH